MNTFNKYFWSNSFIKSFFTKKEGNKMDKALIEVALKEYGVKEIEGSIHNPTIIKYAKEAGFNWVNNDETPWCAIFINWVTMKAGYERTHTAIARDWLKIGKTVDIPEVGDIVILQRGNSTWQGHVGLYVNEDNGHVRVLGGNQSDQVNITKYFKSKVLGYRRLNKMV